MKFFDDMLEFKPKTLFWSFLIAFAIFAIFYSVSTAKADVVELSTYSAGTSYDNGSPGKPVWPPWAEFGPSTLHSDQAVYLQAGPMVWPAGNFWISQVGIIHFTSWPDDILITSSTLAIKGYPEVGQTTNPKIKLYASNDTFNTNWENYTPGNRPPNACATSTPLSDDYYTPGAAGGHQWSQSNYNYYHLNAAGEAYLNSMEGNGAANFCLMDEDYEASNVTYTKDSGAKSYIVGWISEADPVVLRMTYGPLIKTFFDYGIGAGGSTVYSCSNPPVVHVDYNLGAGVWTSSTPVGQLSLGVDAAACGINTDFQATAQIGTQNRSWVNYTWTSPFSYGEHTLCWSYWPDFPNGQEIFATSSLIVESPSSWQCINQISTSSSGVVVPNLITKFLGTTSVVELLTGKNPHDQACSVDEWNTPDPRLFYFQVPAFNWGNALEVIGLWGINLNVPTTTFPGIKTPAFNLVKIKCFVFASGFSSFDIFSSAIKLVFNSLYSVLSSLFPFDIPLHIYGSWVKSDTGEVTSSLAFLANQVDVNGNLSFSYPAEWSGSFSTSTGEHYVTTSIIAFGPGVLMTDSHVASFFSGIKSVSTYFLWLLFLIEILVLGNVLYHDLTLEDTTSPSVHLRPFEGEVNPFPEDFFDLF